LVTPEPVGDHLQRRAADAVGGEQVQGGVEHTFAREAACRHRFGHRASSIDVGTPNCIPAHIAGGSLLRSLVNLTACLKLAAWIG